MPQESLKSYKHQIWSNWHYYNGTFYRILTEYLNGNCEGFLRCSEVADSTVWDTPWAFSRSQQYLPPSSLCSETLLQNRDCFVPHCALMAAYSSLSLFFLPPCSWTRRMQNQTLMKMGRMNTMSFTCLCDQTGICPLTWFSWLHGKSSLPLCYVWGTIKQKGLWTDCGSGPTHSSSRSSGPWWRLEPNREMLPSFLWTVTECVVASTTHHFTFTFLEPFWCLLCAICRLA